MTDTYKKELPKDLRKTITKFEHALTLYTTWPISAASEKECIRDAAIYRFNQAIDLLWQYIQLHLEQELYNIATIISPNSIIRHACNARIITEQEATNMLEMVHFKSKASKMYQEKNAEILSGKLPSYLATMQQVAAKINI